tara:strand:+ start:3428 stop:4102 length:675 start_codon:yes stop_codon:yes gene_type:complete
MAETIKVVQGDELPQIVLTLTDDTANSALDLSLSTTSVSIKFRKRGTTTTLSTITTTKTTNGTDGKITFDFAGGILDVDPGEYEGEIVINYNGSLQTVYDILKFRVRANTVAVATTNTYTVTVGSGTLYGGGSGNVFILSGASNPAITFVRGSTYIFDQSDSSNAGHQLAFKNSSGSSYTTGVSTSGTPGQTGASTTIVVPLTGALPAQYYCTSHGNGMGNLIS